MSLSVIPASDGDALQICALEETCFSLPHTLEQIERELQDGIHSYLCAYDGDSFAGFISCSVIADEVYIGNVAVKNEYRKRGVGSALADALIHRAEESGAAFITLEVRESNAPARALYEKYGFKYIAYLKDYYTAPKEDAIIMTLFISRSEK